MSISDLSSLGEFHGAKLYIFFQTTKLFFKKNCIFSSKMRNYLKNNHLTNCSTHSKCAFLYSTPKLSASNMSIRKLLETHLKKNLPISFFFCNFASSKYTNFDSLKTRTNNTLYHYTLSN
jgi:hypothetical protein